MKALKNGNNEDNAVEISSFKCTIKLQNADSMNRKCGKSIEIGTIICPAKLHPPKVCNPIIFWKNLFISRINIFLGSFCTYPKEMRLTRYVSSERLT